MDKAEAIDALAKRVASFPRRLRRNVAAAEKESAQELKKLALARSSGTIKTRELRRMRHPFALRSPQTPVDPATINRQSGEFKRGWRILPLQITQRGTRTGVVNATLHARYLKKAGSGDSKSVARPIAIAILHELRPRREARLQAALQKTLKETL